MAVFTLANNRASALCRLLDIVELRAHDSLHAPSAASAKPPRSHFIHLFNEDGTIAVTFNGEIYDYAEHRRWLRARGHHLRSAGDTEVLVHLYEELGPAFVERLNGEFAFVLWDERNRRALAARDRVGVKPLYYAHHEGQLFLASEAKAIVSTPNFDRTLSRRFLTGPVFGAHDDETSLFENVKALRPGHVMLVDLAQKSCDVRPYWTPNYSNAGLTFDDAKVQLRERLTRAVRRRMVADVPVHCYLSGGIDSSHAQPPRRGEADPLQSAQQPGHQSLPHRRRFG